MHRVCLQARESSKECTLSAGLGPVIVVWFCCAKFLPLMHTMSHNTPVTQPVTVRGRLGTWLVHWRERWAAAETPT